jgi:hypothetical protein
MSEILDALERHRDHHFRRIPSRRVTGEKSALKFIDEVGFCTGFTAGMGVPCLREAIAGEREPGMPEHIQHDYAIGMTWRIKDSLPQRRAVYYGKVIARRPSFIARAMLDRAMAELQEKFLALKIDERADPFSYVWDTMAHRWPDAIAQARKLTRAQAAHTIVGKYFETAAFGSERAIARLLGIDLALVEAAARRLEREGVIVRGVRIDGCPGAFSLLSTFVS